MPTVPYNPIPSQTPGGQPTPYFTDRGASEAAFGGTQAEAMGRFAGQLEKTATVIETNVIAAQQLVNEADVNAAVTADIQKSGELNNQFRLLPGKQAQEALKKA